jgi:hypothetical protein
MAKVLLGDNLLNKKSTIQTQAPSIRSINFNTFGEIRLIQLSEGGAIDEALNTIQEGISFGPLSTITQGFLSDTTTGSIGVRQRR